MTSADNRSDLVIIGAGLAGLPIALACAQAGWRVHLIDQNAEQDELPSDPLDQRCTAIGQATEGLLRRWALWSHVVDHAEPIHQVHVSQRGHFGAVRLRAEELGVPALGHVIENRHWVRALSAMADTHPNIRLQRGVSITALDASAHTEVTITLDSGAAITARLLIAVDGENSRVRDLTGVGDQHIDYEQCALLTTVQISAPHNGCAFERFTATGPLALLPRPNQTMSVVWCLDAKDAQSLRDASAEHCLAQLQHQFGFRLGRFTAMGAKTVLPLYRREALAQVGTRTVLLGNAARLLHPVAGQGFNLALRDVAALLDVIGQQTDSVGSDPGAAAGLHAFAQSRQRDQQGVVRLTDTLARAFRGRARTAGHLRALGLMGLDSIEPARTRFAQTAMGYRG